MYSILNRVRHNHRTLLSGVAAIAIIVWQHNCIMEALEIIEEADLQDKIK